MLVIDLALLHDLVFKFATYSPKIVVDVPLKIAIDELLGDLCTERLQEMLAKSLRGFDAGLNALNGGPVRIIVLASELLHELAFCGYFNCFKMHIPEVCLTFLLFSSIPNQNRLFTRGVLLDRLLRL